MKIVIRLFLFVNPPPHTVVLELGTIIEVNNGMIEDLKPYSDTSYATVREVDISRRILTVREHRVIIAIGEKMNWSQIVTGSSA